MSKISKIKWCGIFVFAIMMASSIIFLTHNTIKSVYAEEITSIDCLSVGIYKTADEAHQIEVKEDGTIYYDETYALTATGTTEGVVLSGSIGKFYQINSHNFAIKDKISYTSNGTAVTLPDNTVWTMENYEIVETGSVELWRNNEKIGSYKDFQSAILSAESTGDTIKVTKNMTVTAGAVIDGKSITIDGGNFILDKSQWANSIFVVVDGASLTINNLVVDGGATGFEVDYANVAYNTSTIPLVEGSDDNDPVSNIAVVCSTGDFKANNFKVSNTYDARGVRAYRGNVILENCDFIHNYAENGAGISIGSNFLTAEPNDYPITNLKLTNCNFENNYSYKGSGGAIHILHTKNVEMINTNFIKNTSNTYSGNGGAIYVAAYNGSDGYDTLSEQYGLSSGKMLFKNCLFEGNYAGNDGSALHISENDTEFNNCVFKGNVGTQRNGGSVGTVSFYCAKIKSGVWTMNYINNCLFEDNEGAVSCIGDHGGMVKVFTKNTEFVGNKGLYSVLYYTSVASFEGCEFTNEEIEYCVIDVRAYTQNPENVYLSLTNTTFNGTVSSNLNGADIWVRCYSGDKEEDKATVEFFGENDADILLKNGNYISVNGVLIGNIATNANDAKNITISSSSVMIGEISYYNYLYTVKYYNDEESEESEVLSLEPNKTYTAYEINDLLGITKENNILKFYTNNNYTTEWNYLADADETLYAQWEEHTHDFETDYTIIAKDNGIYKQCNCGAIEELLVMSLPVDLVYSGNNKEVTVSTNSVDEIEYTISYQYYYQDNVWISTESPINAGKYRAILTYTEDTTVYTSTLEFKIEKANYDLSNIKFEDLKVAYDNQVHSIVIDGELPEGVTVSYLNNGQTEAGAYIVTAIFSSTNENYNQIPAMTAILLIEAEVKQTNILPYVLISILGTLAVAVCIAIIMKSKNRKSINNK